MKFSIRLFPEITIKSRPVRKRLIQRLQSNLQNMMRRIDEQIRVKGQWDKLDVECEGADSEITAQVIDLFDSGIDCIGTSNFNEIFKEIKLI